MDKPSPIRPTDDEARALGRGLIDSARFAALGVTSPDTGAPVVTRVAFATDDGGVPITLISTLSAHTTALKAAPECSLLVGEPGRLSESGQRGVRVGAGRADHGTAPGPDRCGERAG